jgi:hypothetical protein
VAGDHGELGALGQERVADGRDEFADDGHLVLGEGVQRLDDRTVGAVLDGDDPAVVLAAGDGLDDGRHRLGKGHLVGDGLGRAM